MANLLFWVVLIAIFHFLVESILAPCYRLLLCSEIIKMRDELYTHSFVFPNEVPAEVQRTLDDSFGVAINHLHDFSITLILATQRAYHNNSELAEIIDTRAQIVNSSDSEFIQDLVQWRARIMIKAIFWNCSGWLIYALPLLIAYGIIAKFAGAMSGFKKNIVQKLVYLPQTEYQRLISDKT